MRSIIKNPFKKNTARTAIWLNDPGAHDILCPIGYKPLSKNEEVIKCANIIADLVSSMTVMLMENSTDGDKRLKNELSKKLDINPNSNMTRKNFIFKIAKDMVVSGNSIAVPKYQGDLLSNINLIDMANVTFNSNTEDYKIKIGAVDFNPNELLHFVHVPKQDKPFEGEGYKSAIYETVQNLIQANTTKKGFLKSKWKPSMVISINSDADELQDKEKRKKIIGSYVDTTEQGEPWLIPAGEIDVKTISPLTLKDLAIQESITLDIQTIAAAMGIPSFLVGIGDFNKEQYNNFIRTTIMSIAQNIQQELTKKLLYSPDMYFKFNPRSLYSYDLKELAETGANLFVRSVMLGNEVRDWLGLSPLEGLNERIILENYIPAGMIGDQNKLKGGEAK